MTEQSAVSNPHHGAESDTHHGAATRPLRIAIVGAGPAGNLRLRRVDEIRRRREHRPVRADARAVRSDPLRRRPRPPRIKGIKGIITALHKVLDKDNVRLLGNIDDGVDHDRWRDRRCRAARARDNWYSDGFNGDQFS